ncbi:MAG: hypothetical protein ACRDSN_05580 [Pseudonocardiaceae bacterium]
MPQAATVVRLRPIRTLTIARDLAFRRRAMTVLAELGPAAFAVMAPEPTGEVAALVVQQGADVVVLDVTGSAAALPQVLASLSEHAPRVGVVAISDRSDRAGHDLHVLAKWSWAAELTRAVQDAYRLGNPLKEGSSNVRHQQS